jgi:3-oxoacyl-(acyl-carrier-protein) synthase
MRLLVLPFFVALHLCRGRAPPTTTVSADLDPAFADLRVLTPDNAAALAAERQLEKEPGSAGIEYALSNSFAFGGSNASVLLKKYRP